jgi:uncharacterized protein (DUF1786 family)
MRILAIDIGAGTQDILLFDPEKILRIVPALFFLPSKIFAERLRRIEGTFIHGDTIGGGPLREPSFSISEKDIVEYGRIGCLFDPE